MLKSLWYWFIAFGDAVADAIKRRHWTTEQHIAAMQEQIQKAQKQNNDWFAKHPEYRK